MPGVEGDSPDLGVLFVATSPTNLSLSRMHTYVEIRFQKLTIRKVKNDIFFIIRLGKWKNMDDTERDILRKFREKLLVKVPTNLLNDR